MAAPMVRQTSGSRFRSGRFIGRRPSGEDNVQLDFQKDSVENVKEILAYVIKQTSFSKAKKLGYLNAFVKLIVHCGKVENLGLPLRSIFICLSVNLLHASKEVRAGTLRVIRHLVTDESSLQILLNLHIDYLIARALDLYLDNEIERVHAQKFVRHLVVLVPGAVPRSLLNPLVAIGSDGGTERDRMVSASLACLCELTYANPELVSQCGGISMLLRKILDSPNYPRINESLVATILHLVNYPATRHYIHFNTDLEQLIAPFTDCHFSYSGDTNEQVNLVEDQETRFAASRMAVVTVMRSWPGIIRFCRPDGAGIQSLIGILYLPFQEIRHALLELVYELFRINLPDSTSDFTQALLSVDPSKMMESWHITEGFVANEAKSILPNIATIRPNLVENHLALLLSAWIRAGILSALVEVIISTDGELYVRAVILLGELLYLANLLLPSECSHHSHYLPTLVAMASSMDTPSNQRQQARKAVSYLDRIHCLKKRGPIPCSLYLEQLLRQSGFYKDRPLSLNMQKNKLLDMHIRKRASSSEEVCLQTLRDTQVLFTKTSHNWDWDLIEYVLKWPDDKLRKLEDQTYSRFIKRLAFFYKPTNHQFSREPSDHEFQKKYALVGCHLVDFLIRCETEEGQKIVSDLLADIALCLSEVALRRLAPESVLSPGNIINTLAHYYFLFIGRFSLTTRGDRQVEKAGIYQHFLDIITSAPQDSYVKLIVSSLNYGREGNCRAILSKALCAGQESGRLYATKFMRVLLRAKMHGFSGWGIERLVGQLYDQSLSVAMTALTVLEEACELKENLDEVIKLKPNLLHLGDKGMMMLCRYMSTQAGFKFLTEANYTMNELTKWHNTYNTKYVSFVEELLNEALTTYEKTYEGSYTRRSNKRRKKLDVYVPTHLYSQLVQHKDSFNLLKQQTYVGDYFEVVRSCEELKSEADVLEMKTALWAVGNISMSSWGVGWLKEETIVPEIIRKAEECSVYSIRGTAFFVLGLVSSTREGAELLSQYGWESRWNNRSERWPLVEDHTVLLDDALDEAQTEACFQHSHSRLELNSPSSLDFIVEERFKMKIGNSDRPNGGVGEAENVDEESDCESGIQMLVKPKGPGNYSPDLRSLRGRLKSSSMYQTGSGSKSYMLPPRSQTFRGASRGVEIKGRTQSVEHLSASTGDLLSISSERRERSLSANIPVDGSSSDIGDHATVAANNNVDSSFNKQYVKDETGNLSPETVEHFSEDKTSVVKFTGVINFNQQHIEKNLIQKEHILNDVVPVSFNECDQIINHQHYSESDIQISVTDSENQVIEQMSDSRTPDGHIETTRSEPLENSSFKMAYPVDIEQGSKSLPTENSVRKSAVSLIREKSNGSDSSQTTNSTKSRTDSFNTDSTTSGVGSYDSGLHGVVEGMSSLSPIPSSHSLENLEHFEVEMRRKDKPELQERMHHSVIMRKISHLSRVPSFRRQSSPSAGIATSFDYSDNAIMYTTARDAMGYATLRNLRNARQISMDNESDMGLNMLYGSSTSLNRRPSIDSTYKQRPTSLLTYNLSGVSLSDLDNPAAHQPKARLYQQRPHTGMAEFMGLSLPVDINMIFETSESDDSHSVFGGNVSRSESFNQNRFSRANSVNDSATSEVRRNTSGLEFSYRQELDVEGSRSRSHSTMEVSPQPLSSEHNVDVCIQCRGMREEKPTETIEEWTGTGIIQRMYRSGRRVRILRTISCVDGDRSSSHSSDNDHAPPAGEKMTFDTNVGRTLVRKELLRFVINLSSSVGVKGAEQGLLSLKQKFPRAFQDLCFYSDVSHLLATCFFRLPARRFIQELFEDLDISKLVSNAFNTLGIDEASDRVSIDKPLPEQYDGFEEFS